MIFEWDPKKAAVNLAKHGVSFSEATTVFYDRDALIFDDDTHSTAERREFIVGRSLQKRYLFVSFTERDPSLRIISARRAHAKEIAKHENNKERRSKKAD